VDESSGETTTHRKFVRHKQGLGALPELCHNSRVESTPSCLTRCERLPLRDCLFFGARGSKSVWGAWPDDAADEDENRVL